MAGAASGGAENFFVRLVTALGEEGIDQQAVIRPCPARRSVLERHGVVVHEAPYRGILDLFTRGRLKRIAGTYGPDIVMASLSASFRKPITCMRRASVAITI